MLGRRNSECGSTGLCSWGLILSNCDIIAVFYNFQYPLVDSLFVKYALGEEEWGKQEQKQRHWLGTICNNPSKVLDSGLVLCVPAEVKLNQSELDFKDRAV